MQVKKITTFNVIAGPTCVNCGNNIEELFGQLKMLFLTVKAGNELYLVVSTVILRLLLELSEKEFRAIRNNLVVLFILY